MEQRTVGLACEKETAPAALSAISAACLDLAWVVHSFDVSANVLGRMPPSVVLAQYSATSPGFWLFLDRVVSGSPRPALGVFGSANVGEAFRLAATGVDRYFESLVADELADLDHVAAAEDRLVSSARKSVGQIGVKEAQRLLRAEMFRTALDQTAGNRHAAARLLRVDRRYVLKMLNEHPEIAGPQARPAGPGTSADRGRVVRHKDS